ncbi:MAG TPA: YdeI/OmpD-associated family protein, partial [Acidobacteriota bacterium]|nr:YdeI/OmpD-associated family protein [Acidobacteriota bacterium]
METKPRLFKTREAWRRWLASHHDTSAGLWIAYYKKGSGKTSVTYEDALQEALCYGWIDSVVRRIDKERYAQKYTPRKPGSIWSASNKSRIKKLIAEERMAPPGLAKVRAARRDGSWDRLSEIDRIGRGASPPGDLLEALARTPGAKALFDARPPSEKRLWSYWVLSARRPEPRARRIAETVRRVRAGRRP